MMKVEILEETDNKLRIQIDDTLTLANVLNENIWKQKVDYSAFHMDHPYLSKPVVVVKSKNPKKSVLDAADEILSDVKDLRKQITTALK